MPNIQTPGPTTVPAAIFSSFFPRLRTLAQKRFPAVFLLMLGLFLSGCSFFSPGAPTPKQLDVTGVSGTVNPKAEQLLAKAHILWKNTETCSDPEQAIVYLDQALALEPMYAMALLRRGMAYSEAGFHDEAFEDLTRSIRLAPTAEAYCYRGLALLRQGNFGAARQDLNLALEKDPHFYRAWNFRAALNLKIDQPDAACDDFSKACSNGDCTGIEKARSANMCR